MEDQVDEHADLSEDWTNLIDRGGLKHVNNDTHRVMLAKLNRVWKVFFQRSAEEV